MLDQFIEWIKPTTERIENLLKFASYTRATGSNGKLQDVQIKSVRNVEEALKMSNFGFNSKAPKDSRAVVAKIGNENIVIANEHLASIIDISTGNSIMYNQDGDFIKVENGTITCSATNIISNCTNYTVNSTNTTVNATSKFTVNSPISEFSANVNVLGLLSASGYSGLSGSAMTTNVNLETTADVQASGISLVNHTHAYTWTDPAGSGNVSEPN